MSENIYSKKIYTNLGNPEVLSCVPREANRILDIGCGAGDNARVLKEWGKYVVGVTISSSEAMIARGICDEIIECDIESSEISIEGKFDCILMSHICEHLINPHKVIERLSLNLSPKGVLIVAIPNMAFYKLRMRLLKGNWTMEESGPFDKTHLHFFSFFTADELYNGNEFKLMRKIPGQLSIPLWPIRVIIPELSKKLDKFIGSRFPNLFSMQTVLVYSKSGTVGG
ncbi:MAG: class I SAM-dependent methyltransferase [Chitinophagaceae bacterium]|nr:class I SAM-dependent methyltransferase [Chitinophagaceae bacterium]